VSTWVEGADHHWTNLDHVERIAVMGPGPFEVHLELDPETWVVHSQHDTELAAQATVERLLTAAGGRCLRREI
jgi:hypothetical protein